jgi:hypothetical protein
VVDIYDPYGNYLLLPPNYVSGPTANVGVRRAIMACAVHRSEAGEAGLQCKMTKSWIKPSW